MQSDHGYFEEDQIGQVGDWRMWRRLMAFVTLQRGWMSLAVALSFIITGTSLALPRLVQLAMDRYILDEHLGAEERVQGLYGLSTLFLIVILAGFVTNFFQVLILEWTGQGVMHAIRQRLFTHILGLNLSFYQRHPVGRLVTRLTNDIQNMHEMLTSVVVTLFNDGVRLIGILIILLWMNWRLALILSLTFPVMVFTTLWFGRLSRDAFRAIRTHLAGINAFIQESIVGITIIQLFLREKDTREQFSRFNQDYYRAALYQIRIFGIFIPLLEVMSSVSMALIIWYGGGEILRKHMSLGELTAFISYMRLFFQPVRELSQKYSIVQSAMASAERIFQILDNDERLLTAPHPLTPELVEGRIAFGNVRFGYDPSRPVLRELSFQVEPGQTMAIVGATGSGKTTIINLLERFYDPQEGEVCLDGVDVRRLDPHWLREQVGLIMQDIFIIPGTLRENIVLDRTLTEEELGNIIALSQLSEVVKRLPQGMETRIGEGGIDLSAGQKQLLAFARVLARDPRILVMDEATANVDTETEMLIEQAIHAVMANRTSLVIAHRLSTIRRADRILVMDHGRLVEQGTHEELMALRGMYYHLQTLQSNGALKDVA